MLSPREMINKGKCPNIYMLCCVLLSHVQLFVTPWTVANQAPLSMGFPRQEYWSGVPRPSPKIAGRNIKTLRYANDTTLTESQEE